MSSYRRVEKGRTETQNKNEIRIKAGDHPVFPYLAYAHRFFEEGNTQAIIKATGNAITKAVHVVELIKRRFKGLHQINELSFLEMEENQSQQQAHEKDQARRPRRVPMLVVILSKDPLDKTHIGYQEPLPEQEVKSFEPGPRKPPPQKVKRGYPQERRYVREYPRYGGPRRGGPPQSFPYYHIGYKEEAYGYTSYYYMPQRGRGSRGRGEGARTQYPVEYSKNTYEQARARGPRQYAMRRPFRGERRGTVRGYRGKYVADYPRAE